VYRYEHTQPGTLIRVSLISLALIFLIGIPLFAAGDQGIWMLAPILCCSSILALFHSLTIRISAEELSFAFGVGLVSKRIAIDEIDGCAIVRTHWYNGWGIKLVRGGLLYNVSGFDAVEVRLSSGRRVLIGTDQPQELHAAIEHAIDQSTRISDGSLNEI
jgi:hypothetical protein